MLHSGGFHLRLEMSEPGFVCVCLRKPLWERKWLRRHSTVCGKNRPTLLWRQLASLITNCRESSVVYKTHPHLSTHSAFINSVTILWCSDRHLCTCSKFAFNYMWYDVWLDFTSLSLGFWLLDVLFTPVCTFICTTCHSLGISGSVIWKMQFIAVNFFSLQLHNVFFLQLFWYFITLIELFYERRLYKRLI